MGGMAKLFLPLYLHESYHVPFTWVGFMISAYGMGALIGSYKGGSLSDRIESSKLVRWFMTQSACCLFLLSLPIPLWLFAPVLLCAGLSDGAFRPVNQRLALEPCPVERRPQAQGMLRVAFNLGVAISGISGGFLAEFGFHWVYLSDAVAAMGAALWMSYAYRRFPVTLMPRGHQEGQAGPALQGPWKDPAYLRMMIGLIVAMAVFDQMYTTLGLFLRQQYHLAPHWLGYLFTINGLMVVILQVPIAHRIPLWGVGRCALLGVMMCGASYLLLLLGQGPVWAILMAIAITCGELLQSPSFVQLVMIRSEGRLRGRYMGLYSAVVGGRTLYAPAIGGWVYGTFGYSVMWPGCAALSLLAVALQFGAVRAIVSHPEASPCPARA
jgi:predicted MFS family arabinose efflux permease